MMMQVVGGWGGRWGGGGVGGGRGVCSGGEGGRWGVGGRGVGGRGVVGWGWGVTPPPHPPTPEIYKGTNSGRVY